MIKIVVDSGCDYNEELINKNNLPIVRVPLTLHLDDKEFIDDDSFNVTDYLIRMENSPNSPKTAAPPPGLFLEKFKGIEKIFAVTLSNKLSSSFNSALLAKDMYLDEIGSKFIHVFDSLSASVGEIIIAMKINEFIKNNIPDNETVDQVNRFIKSVKTYFILEKYDNLIKSGRINPYIAKIASLLSIKPICMGKEGEIVLVDKARGFDKATKKLINIITKDVIDYENRVLGIAHVKCFDKALMLKEEIASKINFKEIFIVDAGGIITTYADQGGIVLAF